MELKISNLTKSYGEIAAVNHVSYTLNEGVYGLLGVNGAGKTTLMRMLCTLQKPTDGSITWNEKDIFQMGGEYRKLIGYLPQDFGYYPDFTVYDYLMYIAAIKGLRPVAAKKRAKLLLKQVGLEKAENMKMKKLSGGMKRRAGIAQAMLNNPSILVLDEPTAGLDPNERIRFRNLISELSEERLVLLSTHIVSDIEYIETIKRKVLFHLRNGENEMGYFKIRDLEERLEQYFFVRCHNGIIVNVDCIESLHDLTVTLYSGDQIYITRSRKQNLMKKMAERGGCI